jgi:chromosome segregation ATPase
MNDAQAAEMLNLLKEMNYKLDKLETSMEKLTSDITRLDSKIDHLADVITEGFDRVLKTHDQEHEDNRSDKRVEKISAEEKEMIEYVMLHDEDVSEQLRTADRDRELGVNNYIDTLEDFRRLAQEVKRGGSLEGG